MSFSVQSVALFTAAEGAMSLSPGPAVMMVVACALARGWRTSLLVTLGILSGNAIYFALSATGLSALILASPKLFAAIKYAGAAYLISLGSQAILGKPSPLTISRLRQDLSHRTIYLQALMLQLSNPKSMLSFIAILPQFIDPALPIGFQISVLALCSILPEFFILLGYGMLASRASRWAGESRYLSLTEKAAGALVIAAGLMVAIV